MNHKHIRFVWLAFAVRSPRRLNEVWFTSGARAMDASKPAQAIPSNVLTNTPNTTFTPVATSLPSSLPRLPGNPPYL